MGLDMYAYAIKADIVEGHGEADVPVYRLARDATGFKAKTAEELKLMTDEEQEKYYSEESWATKQAEQSGLFDNELFYWRKFNALHGWMEALYYAKGGKDESFNCNTVKLTSKDLDQLDADARNGRLSPRLGFFFGGDTIEQEDMDTIPDFIAKARAKMKEGYAVFYDSWW